MGGTAEQSVAEMPGVTLRPDLAFFPLDGDLVVFSPVSQTLVALNATAALIVRKLHEGVPAKAVAAEIARELNATADEADGWVVAALDSLAAQGLLTGGGPAAPAPAVPSAREEAVAQRRAKMPPLQAFEPRAEGRYRLLGTHALIRYAHRAQKRMVDAVIGHLGSDEAGEPNLIIDVQAEFPEDGHLSSNIYCDGKPEAQAAKLSGLGPQVKSALWTHAINAHDFLLDLHAGVVGKEGRCILLPAAAGSGKSSLTAALAHKGFGYYSDEVALIERGSFQVPPVPLAVCVKETGWDLMSRYFPELSSLPIHQRDDRKIVRYVPPRAASVQKSPALVSHIFFPLYRKDQPTRLEPLSRVAAFARLMDQCLALRQRLDHGNVQELVRWIAGIDCYALTFSSLDEAVACIEGVLAAP
jgi:hypothetical protein